MPELTGSSARAVYEGGRRLVLATELVEALPGISAVLDADGIIVAVNAAWTKCCLNTGGRMTEVAVGACYLDHVRLFDGDIDDDHERAGGVRQVLAGTRAAFQQVYACDGPDGLRSYQCEVRPLRGEAGVEGAVVTNIDVTDVMARVAERDVRLNRAAKVAESIGAYWWEWRLDEDCIELSSALARRLGLPGTETSGLMFPRSYVHPDDRVAAAQAFKRVRAGEVTVVDVELRLITRDGPRWVHARGQALHDARGRVERVVGITRDISDRYALSDELARERADSRKLALVAERTDNGVVMTDAKGRVEWVNAGFERLSGYTLADLAGRCPGDLLQGPVTEPDALAALASAIADQRAIRVELVSYQKSGDPYWQEIDLQPVLDDDGVVAQFISIHRDITDRKREAGLHAARAVALRQKLDGQDHRMALAEVVVALEIGFIDAKVAVLVPDASGDNLRCLAAPSLPGGVQVLLDSVPSGDTGGFLGRAAQGTRVCGGKLADDPLWASMISADRVDGLVECWAEPMVGLDGTQQGVLALFFTRPPSVAVAKTIFVEQAAYTVANLIEREAREEALRRSERHFRTLAEVLPLFVSYVDRNFNFRYTNAAHDACLGVKRGSLIGKPLRNIFSEESWVTAHAHLARVLQGERVRCESLRTYCNGIQRYVHATYVPDIDAEGVVVGVHGIIEDITEFRRREDELRAAKEQAQASSAAKSTFLANMSHELRTPLNAIIGYSEMIRSQVLGPLGNSRYNSYVEDIHTSGQHLLDLIENVLDLSKLDAGGVELAREPVALVDVVAQALTMLGMAEDPRVTVDLPTGAAVYGDRRAIRQVLVNLISNAAKYAGTGAIKVVARSDGDDCLISITDRGPGISAADVPRVTEPFYRVGQQNWIASEEGDGAGIGLALAKRLVEEMDGRMVIDSVLGAGTTVTLRMRCAA